MKARPINDLAEANDTFGRIFAALLLLNLAILSINFFIALMNEALHEAKNAIKENELYELVDEYDWKSTQESKVLEIKTPELNSRNGTAINFDLISQTIKNARKQRIQTSGNENPSNKRRKSFFDKISNIVEYLKHANYDDHNNDTKERKVRFRNDVIKSQLRRLRKTKKDLFKYLDGIVQGYSEEEDKFYLLWS